MLLTIFLSFQHWVQLYFIGHIWQVGGNKCECAEEDPTQTSLLWDYFFQAGSLQDILCNNAVSQSKPCLYSSSCSSQILGSLLRDYSGVWAASCLLTKANWSGLRGLLCLGGSWVGGWGDEWTEWSLTSARHVYTRLGHSAADPTCFTLLSDITLWVCLSRSELLSLPSAGYVFYWIP